jgi:hypothetical protein
MTVEKVIKKVIEELKREGKDESIRVGTIDQHDDGGLPQIIIDFLVEEDVHGDLSVVMIADQWRYSSHELTAQELLAKLKQLNPDGQAKAYVRYNGNDKEWGNERIVTTLCKDNVLCICSWFGK